MPVTLKDIAERVGKSVPTVSRALAGFDDISPKTRQEVQRVALEMGYEPNTTARNLQKQRTDTIALILPSTNLLRFSDPFFSEFLSGIVEQAAEFNFYLSISTENPTEGHDTYARYIGNRRFDGFIVVRTQRQDSRIDMLRQHHVPFVAFGRTESDNDFPFVDEDGCVGIRQIVDHLVELGHRRIACITEPIYLTKSYHRLQGFIEGIEAHHLPYDPALIIESNFRQRSGRLSALELLNLPEPPTAIVACNDLLALGAITAAQEKGLVVGRNVSITGFDDILLAEHANPPLTTVHQPAHQLGTMVAQMLLKLITGESVTEKQIILKPSLVIRQSSNVPQ
jgi:LacI family transcriptional regulator